MGKQSQDCPVITVCHSTELELQPKRMEANRSNSVQFIRTEVKGRKSEKSKRINHSLNSRPLSSVPYIRANRLWKLIPDSTQSRKFASISSSPGKSLQPRKRISKTKANCDTIHLIEAIIRDWRSDLTGLVELQVGLTDRPLYRTVHLHI